MKNGNDNGKQKFNFMRPRSSLHGGSLPSVMSEECKRKVIIEKQNMKSLDGMTDEDV